MTDPSSDTANLLWTGGWDSTFRLLQLLLVFGSKVQPYYLLDEARRSTEIEVMTMNTIREQLLGKYPKTKELLLPTQLKKMTDIRADPELTRIFERLLKHKYMGSQYEWLPRFCNEMGIEKMELGFHREGNFDVFLEPFLVRVRTHNGNIYMFDEQFQKTDEYKLFRFFRFPILDLAKLDMQAIAREEGFEELLKLTWFCHKPRAGQPCGVCNPCIQTIEKGLGDRVPLPGRIRYHLRVRPRIAHLLMKYPRYYNMARNLKRKLT